ncbi:MAG: hypothetical protein ABFQ53_03840, partial [Patescibacteria group bacterium]
MSDDLSNLSPEDKEQKIQSLRDMITTAEQTMQSAKAMLLQLEGKKKVGRRKKVEDEGDGQVIQGTFDGQIMIGTDGKQYPIPANYASKSKLVEGDFLKLTIVGNGQFIYKQIGPVPRQNKIGIVGQDSSGNYFVAVDGKPFKVLLASITYFNVEPGDQVAIVTSQDENAQWASIEALLQSSDDSTPPPTLESLQKPEENTGPKTATSILTGSAATNDSFASELNDDEEEAKEEIVKDDNTESNEDTNTEEATPEPETDLPAESTQEADSGELKAQGGLGNNTPTEDAIEFDSDETEDTELKAEGDIVIEGEDDESVST